MQNKGILDHIQENEPSMICRLELQLNASCAKSNRVFEIVGDENPVCIRKKIQVL